MRTPLVESVGLAQRLGLARVWLKLENLQQTGSFKDRGVMRLCEELKGMGKRCVVSSSGGNAGLSAAYCASVLGLEAHVVVPKTTPDAMAAKIRKYGARVEVVGANWNEADAEARALCAADERSGYVPPFDHPTLWKGHSSIIGEVVEDLGGSAPDTIVASVGGGGLLAGLMHGLGTTGSEAWRNVRVVGAETEGAASLRAAIDAGEGEPVALDEIATVATSLGALQVSKDVLRFADQHPGGCVSAVVSDRDAVQACMWMHELHGYLVEPACGAALAGASLAGASLHKGQEGKLTAVVIVCGGSGLSEPILQDYARRFNLPFPPTSSLP